MHSFFLLANASKLLEGRGEGANDVTKPGNGSKQTANLIKRNFFFLKNCFEISKPKADNSKKISNYEVAVFGLKGGKDI